MNRRDSGVAFALVAVLGILAGAIAIPAFRPAAVPAPIPTAAPSLGHVQGVLGRPWSITPLTARTQVDRDLVALLFRGLVRLGPGNAILPDLAERWTVTEKGARWTFHLRADATWHDGVPVTSRDVVYTVNVLHDPDYAGPLASTWAEIQATALDERTVQFDLADPVGGFLQAAALPLLPAHILSGVPVASLADDPYAREPLGNGAFALVEMAADRAVLEPVLPQVERPAGALLAHRPPLGEVREDRVAGTEPDEAAEEERHEVAIHLGSGRQRRYGRGAAEDALHVAKLGGCRGRRGGRRSGPERRHRDRHREDGQHGHQREGYAGVAPVHQAYATAVVGQLRTPRARRCSSPERRPRRGPRARS